MSWLEFIAKMTDSLAWPAAAGIIAVVFRRQLAELVRRLAEMTLPGGAKFVFRELLEESGSAVDKIELDGEQRSTRDRDLAYLERGALDTPDIVAQMLLAFRELESHVQELAAKHGVKGRALELAEKLEERKIITPQAANAYGKLRAARNWLHHVPEKKVSVTEAIDFVGQARVLSDYFNALKKK